MTFSLSALQKAGVANSNHMDSFLDNPGAIDTSAAAAFITTLAAAVAAVSGAASAPASAPSLSVEESARRITFTPTINGAHPKNSKPSRIITHNFPNKESLDAHLKALGRAHNKLIRIVKRLPVFHSNMPSRRTANTDSFTSLGNRVVVPVVFIFTVQGKYINRKNPDISVDFSTPAKAYAYTARLERAHHTLLERAEARRKAAEEQNAAALAAAASQSSPEAPSAPAPAVVVQPSQNSAEPNTAPLSAAAAGPRNADFDEKESGGYTRQETPFDGGITIVERWPIGHEPPPAIPNGFDPQTYDIGTHWFRITTIRANMPAAAPESPSSPLSPASPDTPPRPLAPLPLRATAQSNVKIEHQILEAGCQMITQTWPVGAEDPDYPDAPGGYEQQMVTEEQVGNEWVRCVVYQESAEKPD